MAAGQEGNFVSDTTELLGTTTSDAAGTSGTRVRRSGAGLSSMVLPDLKAMATSMGIKGISAMRKGDLVAAISARQSGSGNGSSAAPTNGSAGRSADRRAKSGTTDRVGAPAGPPPAEPATTPETTAAPERAGRRRAGRAAGAPEQTAGHARNRAATLFDNSTDQGRTSATDADQPAAGDQDRTGQQNESESGDGTRRNRRNRRDRDSDNSGSDNSGNADQQDGPDTRGGQQTEQRGQQDQRSQQQDQRSQLDQRGQQRDRQQNDRQQGDRQNDRQQGDRQQNDRQQNDRQQGDRQNDRQQQNDDDGDGRGGRRRNRYRDRNRRGRDQRVAGVGFADNIETEVRDDDVLVPVAGILDVLDSYAFVRTSGYLSGPNDVYVSLSQVRKGGLRRGDHVTGVIRAPRDGEAQRQKFNALVRLDTVNGLDPEQVKDRPEFTKLTPLYPNERLRLETESHLLTTRVIDLVMPVGKGQRALIVSPPKAGKTMVMQAIANAISTNNPECHLMVVLVDERPEEVTDMQRSVKGEVIASTFDRPPADHTMVAELSIERAKRLVEMGKDVVVLLDSITRLGRAYNLAAPASGRILSGGVDSTALFPPKRFLGAARNIENGGSLTIFASALVETGSAGDTVIYEEFKGTGNAELKLDRRLADKRIFPAIDVDQSSTRKEDLLLSPDELAITVKLRRVLSALDAQQALELVLDRLRKSQTNIEFLMQVAKNTPDPTGTGR